MLELFAGIMIGACLGYTIACLTMTAKRSDECTVTIDTSRKEEYTCMKNPYPKCGDTCCMYCKSKEDCTAPMKCDSHPMICGIAKRG